MTEETKNALLNLCKELAVLSEDIANATVCLVDALQKEPPSYPTGIEV